MFARHRELIVKVCPPMPLNLYGPPLAWFDPRTQDVTSQASIDAGYER